ncbi:MAG TPA: hypothetical protein VE176_12800, partial [Candidatus Limnocylindrales bacterium]|nr:hypothetical protein [Candidatus Limnocylindrales bacterium]
MKPDNPAQLASMSKTNKGDATASFVAIPRPALRPYENSTLGIISITKSLQAKLSKKKGGESPLSFCFAAIDLPQDGRAEGRVRAKWTTALQGLRELVGLAEILQCVRIVDAVVKAALARREPGVNAK